MKKALLIFTLLIGFTTASIYACGMQNQYSKGKAVVSEAEAKRLSLEYLATIDDKTIKIKSIDSQPKYFVVVVINDDQEKIAELQIDKSSGTIRPKF